MGDGRVSVGAGLCPSSARRVVFLSRGLSSLSLPPADLREREPEAGGSHPAAGHPDPAADLPPLLGPAGQHRAHPPAGAPEPGSSQVSPFAKEVARLAVGLKK